MVDTLGSRPLHAMMDALAQTAGGLYNTRGLINRRRPDRSETDAMMLQSLTILLTRGADASAPQTVRASLVAAVTL